jgi:hypothetical protein
VIHAKTNNSKIIGIVGFIGAGKDTAADYLVNFHEYRRESFAGTLKDAVSAVFGWDRTLLEGRTKEAREWREQVDPWWAHRLDVGYCNIGELKFVDMDFMTTCGLLALKINYARARTTWLSAIVAFQTK